MTVPSTETHRCRVTETALYAAPDPASPQVSALLYGETARVFAIHDGWARLESAHDAYPGHAAIADLVALDAPYRPDHRLKARASHLYRAPDVKAPILMNLSLASPLVVTGFVEGFAETPAGFVPRPHIAAIDHPLADIAGHAEALLGAPYRWGGRGEAGIDCSGLVQIALALAGISAPRDSHQQLLLPGTDLGDDLGALARGDLVFFPGHVGIMADGRRLIHANAHHMAVAVEPLAVMVARLRAAGIGEPIRGAKRLEIQG